MLASGYLSRSAYWHAQAGSLKGFSSHLRNSGVRAVDGLCSSFADEEDGVELPSKIVNEDLRKFFMPKKYAEPEPVPEPVPGVGQSPRLSCMLSPDLLPLGWSLPRTSMRSSWHIYTGEVLTMPGKQRV